MHKRWQHNTEVLVLAAYRTSLSDVLLMFRALVCAARKNQGAFSNKIFYQCKNVLKVFLLTDGVR